MSKQSTKLIFVNAEPYRVDILRNGRYPPQYQARYRLAPRRYLRSSWADTQLSATNEIARIIKEKFGVQA